MHTSFQSLCVCERACTRMFACACVCWRRVPPLPCFAGCLRNVSCTRLRLGTSPGFSVGPAPNVSRTLANARTLVDTEGVLLLAGMVGGENVAAAKPFARQPPLARVSATKHLFGVSTLTWFLCSDRKIHVNFGFCIFQLFLYNFILIDIFKKHGFLHVMPNNNLSHRWNQFFVAFRVIACPSMCLIMPVQTFMPPHTPVPCHRGRRPHSRPGGTPGGGGLRQRGDPYPACLLPHSRHQRKNW